MPDFFNPFSGTVTGQETDQRGTHQGNPARYCRGARSDPRVHAHADATDNALAKAVLTDIANEERVHAGELQRLLAILTGEEDEFQQKGKLEVDTVAAEIAAPAPAPAAKEEPTIGSLRNTEA